MTNPWIVLLLLITLVVIVIGSYLAWPSRCPTELHTYPDGQVLLKPTGKSFENLDTFQQWWDKSEFKKVCKLPVATGKGGRKVEKTEIPPEKEKTYATTPINKVDDYEFSRIFGREEDGKMVVDKDEYNTILFDRTHDWVNKPYSSEERKQIAGRLPTIETFTGDTMQQVKEIVLKAYSSEPDYEPVLTQVGVNNWEVNELKPKRTSESDREVDTIQSTPDIDAHASFQYRTHHDIQSAIDPYFSNVSLPEGRYGPTNDPFGGPVPGMERMFGPTFDTTKWV
jgi:hypothetical protein